MKKLSNFKTFESKEEYLDYLDYLTIKDLFIDLIDDGYEMITYDNDLSKIGKYFFEFRKSLSEDELGCQSFMNMQSNYIERGHAYGYSNLSKIKSEVDKSISIIEESRDRLTDLGYTIGFEMEFNFSTGSLIVIVCHMQHSKYDQEED